MHTVFAGSTIRNIFHIMTGKMFSKRVRKFTQELLHLISFMYSPTPLETMGEVMYSLIAGLHHL
jgi:hypothetical protein